MLHEQRFFFFSSWAIACALSCVYGRSLLTGSLISVRNTTFGVAAGDTLFCRVNLHAVPKSCLLLPSGTVTGISTTGLTRRARLALVCATTLVVVGGNLQLENGVLLLALCRLGSDPWWCRWATWQWKGYWEHPAFRLCPAGRRSYEHARRQRPRWLPFRITCVECGGLWPTARSGEPQGGGGDTSSPSDGPTSG